MVAGNTVVIETLGTGVVYENRWMHVHEEVRPRDGSEGIYGVVEKPDFVVIAPLEEDGGIHLVQQYRYPVGTMTLSTGHTNFCSLLSARV